MLRQVHDVAGHNRGTRFGRRKSHPLLLGQPEFWLNLQQMHGLSKACLKLKKTLEKEVEVYDPQVA